MAKVRIDSELKEEMKNYLEESSTWSKQSEFVNHAVRELLKREKGEVTDVDKEAIREIIDEELDERS